MARSTKMTPAKPTAAATAPVRAKRRSAIPDPAPTATPRAKTKVARSVAAQAGPKVTAARGNPAAGAVPTRVPPPSKGELRAQIDKLETAHAALKAKGREANRTAKTAARRVAELEEQVAQLQAEAAQPKAPPAPPVAKAKIVRRGRPPGRRKGIDPGDAAPRDVAVQDSEPLDEEAVAARDALEENLSGR